MAQAPRSLMPHLSAQHLFGAELRHWRELRGLSQDGLGSRINFSGDYISKVEKAERFPPAALAKSCDAVLETGGILSRMWPTVEHHRRTHADIGPAHADGASRTLSVSRSHPLPLLDTYWPELLEGVPPVPRNRAMDDGEGDVRRRQLLALRAATLTTHLQDLLDREPDRMRATLDSTSVAERHLTYLENVADILGERAVQLPPLQLLEPTLTRFRSVCSLLGKRQCTANRLLVRSASKLATVAGEILFNQDVFREARRWYSAAMHAALGLLGP